MIAKRNLAKNTHLSFGVSTHIGLRASGSLVANIVLNGVNTCVQADSVLLHRDLLLDDGVDLLLEEVALVDVVLLELLVVLLKVGDVLDDLLQDVVGGLRCVMLKCGTLASQQLHLLLVVVKQLDSFLRVPL